ncbi:PAS and ANTAR domain-containing protein [[Mycobacterium] wendilense]|uniref:PAS and ANTAR domain-containing protein n=1 Tax=[Mycobacterium] wendilense TaxID=3064284 RepID=A0ABN9P9A7_9MYCO|nr:PAS and ANTAR domain-containing protein [Mycolicibacterium sp. MU0050]CAJ1587016.1 PAS and ANTAR domain-containing protein [Mycolicibacterium sp. MU0050]
MKASGDLEKNGSPAHVGNFTLHLAEDQFRWSPEIAAMHGYPREPMTVTTEFALAHKHPEDRPRFAALLGQLPDASGAPLSSRHRIIDRHGNTRHVLVASTRLVDADGAVIGADGFYVDVSGAASDQLEDALDSAVADFSTNRAVIEQAKGMLMLIYDIPADRAFDILRWRSQHTNVKLRSLCEQLIDTLADESVVGEAGRTRVDHIVMTIGTQGEPLPG